MLRLFLSLHPPLEVARALLDALQPLALPAHRATPLDQLHMTVLFVGDVEERRLAATIESAERAAASIAPFQLAVTQLETLPERGPARLVAAATDAPRALLELHARLVARLATKRARPAPLHPHLTLCRFNAPTRFELPSVALAPLAFGVDALSLQHSTLRPSGAEHRQLKRISLANR